MTRTKRHGRWGNLLAALLFLGGMLVLFYPLLSDRWNVYRNGLLISAYEQTVAEIPKEDFSGIWAQANEYNRSHAFNEILSPLDENKADYILGHPYDTLLNPTKNGVMGFIDIPKIGVRLPIYHGVGKTALENGCGHVEGTSLPVGGAGTHAVLSAHRGLPSAKLFTDLDQLGVGDHFMVHVLNDVLTYRVDQILTVLPNETQSLALVPDRDLVTLVTCTPYSVNTHRLLVRGRRVANLPEDIQAEEAEGQSAVDAGITERLLLFGLSSVVLFVLLFMTLARRRRRKAEREKNKEGE